MKSTGKPFLEQAVRHNDCKRRKTRAFEMNIFKIRFRHETKKKRSKDQGEFYFNSVISISFI